MSATPSDAEIGIAEIEALLNDAGHDQHTVGVDQGVYFAIVWSGVDTFALRFKEIDQLRRALDRGMPGMIPDGVVE